MKTPSRLSFLSFLSGWAFLLLFINACEQAPNTENEKEAPIDSAALQALDDKAREMSIEFYKALTEGDSTALFKNLHEGIAAADFYAEINKADQTYGKAEKADVLKSKVSINQEAMGAKGHFVEVILKINRKKQVAWERLVFFTSDKPEGLKVAGYYHSEEEKNINFTVGK